MPEGDSLHRAAARLQPARRAPPDGDVAASARARHRRREGGRRPPARGRRGGREEPPAPLRGRRHGAEPPAHERALARRAGRLDRRRSSVARPARRDGSRRPSGTGPVLTLDLGPVRRLGPDLLADGSDPAALVAAAPPGETARGRSARCSRTSASSRASGTCGCRRRSGPSALSPWLPLAEARDEELARGVAVGADGDASLGRGCAAAARRVPPRRASVRPLRDADRVPRPGRRQPHRLLVPGVPAARASGSGSVSRLGARGYLRGMTATTLALPARYRGTELIATGGMADVYAATDDTLDRRVAIKILNERFAGDPEIRTRFTREARIAARLSIEPNVVTIFDVADVAGQPAIVMEFLPGGTLADRMRAGTHSAGARPCVARAGGAGARCRARRGRRPSRRQAREPDARSRRRGARDRLRDRPDRRRRRR